MVGDHSDLNIVPAARRLQTARLAEDEHDDDDEKDEADEAPADVDTRCEQHDADGTRCEMAANVETSPA